MALKSKITKAEFDALHDILKSEYKEKDGAYLLDSDDANDLRIAKDRETEIARQQRERADQLQRDKDAAEEATRQAVLDKAKKEKDIETLETSWNTKLETAVNAEKANTARREDQLRQLLVENKALEIANEISISPKLILPHIRERLSAELDGEKPITRVLDAEGKPSAKTLVELKAEFIDNKEFSHIIKGSNGSGGGANGNNSGGGAGKDFIKMSEAERVSLNRDNPTLYRELAKAAGVTIY